MQTRIGPLLIESDASCAPQRRLDGIAWQLSCAGKVTNAGRRRVYLAASVVGADGQAQGQTQKVELDPGASVELQDPGQGNSWLVVAVSREQAELWGWAALGGAAVVLGLAGYGVYAAARDIARRRRGRR
jgi:hypothetical protein